MNQKNVKKQKESSPQYTNIVGIDPSTTCSGICINGELISISASELALTKKGKFKKWYETASSNSEVKTIESRKPSSIYSSEELSKLTFYREFSSMVLDVIDSRNLDPTESLVAIEGYSYGSSEGNLIDLVTFSTLIRIGLLTRGYTIKVISPSTLKLCTAKMCYAPTQVPLNKKETRFKEMWYNSNGVPGGKFKKPDMLLAIIDNPELDCNWKRFLVEHYSDLQDMKSVPKPIEDLNDAYLLYNIHKKGFAE